MIETEVRALSYLLTAVIHRLHETDPAWWRDFLDEVKAERDKAVSGDAQVIDRAVGILEHALKPQAAMAAHGQ